MFKIDKRPGNRVDIHFEGTLDADGMRTALDELIEASREVEKGKMLYRIGDFHMPTLGAFIVEMSRLPSLLGLMRKYDKCAVVSEKEWIRSAAEIEGALIPGLKIRSFEPDEEDGAEAWLSV